MRLFIALDIPADIKTGIARAQTILKNSRVSASWPKADGIHLTLKFLGKVPKIEIPKIKTALESAALSVGSFQLNVCGAGAFPNEKNARVAWIGISGEVEKLKLLQIAVENAMASVGFKPEDRPFVPHLTIGRIKHIPSLPEWTKGLNEIKKIAFSPFTAHSVCLVKSDLCQSGAVYTELASIPLKS
ncbi:MAG: RNA 2',3'-cyclic phosphodiesterase [Nitrospirota bacterium]